MCRVMRTHDCERPSEAGYLRHMGSWDSILSWMAGWSRPGGFAVRNEEFATCRRGVVQEQNKTRSNQEMLLF